MSKINSYYCPKCGKFTKHIKISYREYCALTGFDTSTQIVGGVVCDFLGLGKVFDITCGVNPYKCMECGKASSRNLKGGVALGGDPEELKNEHWD